MLTVGTKSWLQQRSLPSDIWYKCGISNDWREGACLAPAPDRVWRKGRVDWDSLQNLMTWLGCCVLLMNTRVIIKKEYQGLGLIRTLLPLKKNKLTDKQKHKKNYYIIWKKNCKNWYSNQVRLWCFPVMSAVLIDVVNLLCLCLCLPFFLLPCSPGEESQLQCWPLSANLWN